MCDKPLKVTRSSLTPSCTSLCDGSSCNTNGLRKGLLIKNMWCASWATPASSSSTCHPHKSNGNLRFSSLLLVVNLPTTNCILIKFMNHRVQYVFRTPKVMFSNPSVHHTIYHTKSSHNSSTQITHNNFTQMHSVCMI